MESFSTCGLANSFCLTLMHEIHPSDSHQWQWNSLMSELYMHIRPQVFVEAPWEVPVHTRSALFGTLVDAFGDRPLAIMALLLRRATVGAGFEGSGADSGPAPVHGEEVSALVEFVDQTCHFAGAQAQVRGGSCAATG